MKSHKNKFSYFKARNAHIIEAYNNGVSIQELSQRYQHTEMTIKRIVGYRAKYKRANKGVHAQIKLRNEGIVLDLCAKIPLEEIAKKYDVSVYTVEYVRNKHRDTVKKVRSEKEFESLVKKHKERLEQPIAKPKKYSPEWTEQQWAKAYQEGRL